MLPHCISQIIEQVWIPRHCFEGLVDISNPRLTVRSDSIPTVGFCRSLQLKHQSLYLTSEFVYPRRSSLLTQTSSLLRIYQISGFCHKVCQRGFDVIAFFLETELHCACWVICVLCETPPNVENRNTFCAVYTEHMWGTSKLARQVSTLQVAAHIILLCAAVKDASDLPPGVLCHTEGNFCKLSREFRSSQDVP